MTFKSWAQLIFLACSVITLAACSSKHKMHDDMAVNDANAAYSDDAQTAGLGDENQVNDEVSGKRHLSANHRVYHFDFDSSNIREEDRPAIIANANKLAAQPNKRVLVEGHTDPRGSREYNIGLGERRANAVSRTLSENGVSRSQMRIVSYGAEKRASQGQDESAYQEDRRAVLADVQR